MKWALHLIQAFWRPIAQLLQRSNQSFVAKQEDQPDYHTISISTR
ncbi:MAG: hypothetical protein PVI99_01885 [Anaerolineales bacterium]|jgi:hypothetical protein